MTPWEEVVKNSNIVELLNSASELVNSIDRKQLTDLNREHLSRIESFISTAHLQITSSHEDLLNPSAVPRLASSISNLNSYLQSWIGGSGENYLTSYAQGQVDEGIAALVSLSPKIDIPEAKEAISHLRRSVAQHRRVVDQLIDQIKEKGSLADETIDQKVNETLEQFQNIQASVSELDDKLSSTEETISKVAAQQTTEFSKAESDRSTSFNNMLTQSQESLRTNLEELQKKSSDVADKLLTDIKQIESEAETAKKRTEKILQISSRNALITDYSKSANKDWVTTMIWQGVTVISIIVAISFAYNLAEHATADMPWQKLVAKALIVLAAGGLATYSAKQASESRDSQRSFEHMSLQLSAVRPYLEDISDKAERDKLLIKIADKLFGARKTNDAKKPLRHRNEELVSANDLMKFVKDMINKYGPNQ